MHKHKQSKAFTIVEVIITITVIAVLAAIITVGYGAVRNNAESAAAAAALKQVENFLEKASLRAGGTLPASLASVPGISDELYPEGYTSEYIRYNNNTEYCIAVVPTDGSDGESQYMNSFGTRAPAAGKCSEASGVAEGFLAYSNEKGVTVMFDDETDAYGDVTLYAAFEISSMDAAWSSMARSAGITGSVQLDQANAGSNGLRVRADTSAATNVTITQSGVRTNGKHVGWTQVRNNVTEIALAYDSAAEFSSRSITPGDGMRLTSLRLQTNSAGMEPLGALVFNKAHSEEERARVLQWLAWMHDVPGTF